MAWCQIFQKPHLISHLPQHEIDDILCEFCLYSWQFGFSKEALGNKWATIAGKISAIKWAHTYLGAQPLKSGPSFDLLRRGFARLTGDSVRKKPISIEILHAMAQILQPFESSSPKSDSLLWGLIVLAFFFLLRRSEFALSGPGTKGHALLTKDLLVLDKNNLPTTIYKSAVKVAIHLRSNKTDQSKKGTTRVLFKSGDIVICPVRAALLVKRVSNLSPETPVAFISPKNFISYSSIANIVKRAARSLGLDPVEYASHSIRAGGATYMFRAGVDPVLIKLHGRWLSDVFQRYIHMCESSVRVISQEMVSNQSKLLHFESS
jgi:hypothetical protein